MRNGKSVALYGEPPKALAIMRFDSLEKAQAVFGSKAYTDVKAIGDSTRRSASAPSKGWSSG